MVLSSLCVVGQIAPEVQNATNMKKPVKSLSGFLGDGGGGGSTWIHLYWGVVVRHSRIDLIDPQQEDRQEEKEVEEDAEVEATVVEDRLDCKVSGEFDRSRDV